MNGVVTLTSSAPCWHDGAQVSEGPTTHQRNWWCPACGAQRTTFPDDSAEAHFAARVARSQAPAVAPEPAAVQNPYKQKGSLEEAWERGFHGLRMLAAKGSNYATVYAEGQKARADSNVPVQGSQS